MTSCIAINRVAGDTGPDLYSEFEGIDLTGKTISLTVRYEQGGELNKPAVIDDASAGTFHFVWDATDLVEGNHKLEYVVTESGGSIVKRFPTEKTIFLIVRAQA
jgi:hypothetical protein